MIPVPTRRLALALALLAVLGGAAPARAGLDAFKGSPHGDPVRGPRRDPRYRPGTCLQCHGKPVPGGGAEARNPKSLFAANDNGLCLSCHQGEVGSFPGEQAWLRATHATSPRVIWPGPSPKARASGDAGFCLNCHDPHGRKDAKGLIPHLLLARGDALCLGCHGFTGPGADVASDLQKVHRHGGVAVAALRATTTSPAPACVDCHNPHRARSDALDAAATLSGRVAGVARVKVANGGAGATPFLTAVGPLDRSPVREYEVCFRCHAGSATTKLGAETRIVAGGLTSATAASIGAAFNPANASTHPVEAAGRDGALDPGSFVNGWRPERLVTCSDCHGSDNERVRGPHGSANPGLLRLRYPTSGAPEGVRPTDLCFTCHAYGAYGAATAGQNPRASRFPSHLAHSARGYSCHACHQPHGSASQPSLLTLRTPGLVGYTRTPTGGTCTVTCHTTTSPVATYRVSYAR